MHVPFIDDICSCLACSWSWLQVFPKMGIGFVQFLYANSSLPLNFSVVSKAAGCDPNGVAREVEVAAQENRAFVLQNQKESTGGYKCPC